MDDNENALTDEDVALEVKQLEAMYNMSSVEFLRAWRAGTAPDEFETNYWAMILQYGEQFQHVRDAAR